MTKKIRNILFDLDGTLTDPFEGITNCLRYSLENLNIPCPRTKELASYIGPPLRQTFSALLRSTDDALIERAVVLYRERFAGTGLYENRVYENVPEMLKELTSHSCSLFVATSKVKVYAERILDHFSLGSYFVEVFGSEPGGRFDDKAELLEELIRTHNLVPRETMMVGDRKHDVIAAKKNRIWSLGVTYGYGSIKELREAGADYVCRTPMDVVMLVKDA
ncbi:MAG: HAD hydrolase-like protein [Acidobacteria bacterium]|nr:HAD hydrolase-like protein [Acidobacteriota bacterium]